MSAGLRDTIKVRIEPGLRSALAEAAQAQQTTASALLRGALRRIVADRSAPSRERTA